MTRRDAEILIHGTEIAERRIRSARWLQADEFRRKTGAVTRAVARTGAALVAALQRVTQDAVNR